MKRWRFYIILFFIPLLTTCLESPVMTTGIVNGKEKPTVATQLINLFVDDGSLRFQGEIVSEGKSKVTERGFYWSTDSRDPDLNDHVVISGENAAVFTYNLIASGKKTYYWRAYAKNSYGYDYGVVDSCETPDIWVFKQPLPTDSRGSGAVFTLNNKIYMTCGVKTWAPIPVEDTWEYSIAANQWSQADIISFPNVNNSNHRRYPVVFTLENLAFVGTGQQSSSVLYKDFWQFNAVSQKWDSIPTPDDLMARYEAVAFSLGGNGYLVGGFNGTGLNDVWQYTYSSSGGSWEKQNNFPVNFYGGISISDNNRAFAGLGDDSESTRTLWEYNKTTDSWSEFAQLPDSVTTKIYSGVIVQNTIYIVDGDNIIWALNMSDRTWTKKSSLPPEFLNEYGEGGYQMMLTTGSSNSIYVGLGFSQYLYEYCPLWDN